MARYYDEFNDDYYRYGLHYEQDEDIRQNRRAYSANLNNNKSTSKRSVSCSRGSAMSFGFRRRPTSGIPVPIVSSTSSTSSSSKQQKRSKSVDPTINRNIVDEEDYNYQQNNQPRVQYPYPTSGRSTPRLAPPKKESSGLPIRTNRFGFRHQQPKYTDKVSDFHPNYNFNRYENDSRQDDYRSRYSRSANQNTLNSRSPRQTSNVSHSNYNYYTNNINNNNVDISNSRRAPENISQASRYTLHSSNLPQPQYVRLADANSKIAKTVVNQSRKISGPSRMFAYHSKDGSSTEDSGLGSHYGAYSDESGIYRRSRADFLDSSKPPQARARRLNVILNGQSFDVRDVDEEHHITEISVIPLPKDLTVSIPKVSSPGGLSVRERASQYQRFLARDNRYADSTTSMSTTSSEGYDEGLGEEKAYKDIAKTEKAPRTTLSCSDFSITPSSEEQEYGIGEAMADEFSICSSEDFEVKRPPSPPQFKTCNIINQSTSQHFRAITNAAKSGVLPTSTLKSVMLTIDDPAFAAVAATTTLLIDDETSPVDSLFDSPTASESQSDDKTQKKEIIEKSGNTAEDEGPGTPTNASNSLSLSEGREFFDDEIADQPGLVFDDTLQDEQLGQTDESQTVLGNTPIITNKQIKSIENSPMHIRKMNRAGSISTLSSCDSIASDDLMLDFEKSEAGSHGENSIIMQELDDATSTLELDAQGNNDNSNNRIKSFKSLVGSHNNANTTNNNVTIGLNNNQTIETGISSGRTRLLQNRSSTDSTKSLDNSRSRPVFSPLRPSSKLQSPSLDSGDESSLRLDRGNYNSMFQDIVSIKTMLLKLKRVLQESGENGLMRESLNPFDTSLKNGFSFSLNESTTDLASSEESVDEVTELKRHLILLQNQIEDKDRTIQYLQSQISKFQSINSTDNPDNAALDYRIGAKETSDAMTQTENKTRSLSLGSSQNQIVPHDDSPDSYISWNDVTWSPQKQHQMNLSELGMSNKCQVNKLQMERLSLRSSSPKSKLVQYQDKEIPFCIEKLKKSSPKISNSKITNIDNNDINKSSIPTPPRRLAVPTLIPRAARAVSTGRSNNV